MLRGEIWDVDIPSQLAGSGHEQAGFRPALIVSVEPDPLNTVCVIIPSTSKLKAQELPHTLLVYPTETNGLDVPSVLLVGQIRAIDKRRVQTKRGVIEAVHLAAVEDMLRKLLGL